MRLARTGGASWAQVGRAAGLSQQAVAEYGGPLLADTHPPDWLLPHRERLLRRYAATAIRAGDLLIATGAVDEPLRLARLALAADDSSEPAHQLLISAHLAADDPHAARLALDDCHRMLDTLAAPRTGEPSCSPGRSAAHPHPPPPDIDLLLSAREHHSDAARALLDAAVVGGNARHDLWWMPEVLRMRAAYDEPEAARARLRSAAQLASAHGSLALLRRCTNDLLARGVPVAAVSVRTNSEMPAGHRNAARTPPS